VSPDGANNLYDGLTLRNDSVIWKTGALDSDGGGYPTAGIIDFDIDVGGWHRSACISQARRSPVGEPTVFRDGSCAGYTGEHAITGDILHNKRVFDFVRATNKQGAQLGPSDFDVFAAKPEKGLDLVIRVQHEDGSAYEMTWKGSDPEPRIGRINAFDSSP
jgi:hypothetical protein